MYRGEWGLFEREIYLSSAARMQPIRPLGPLYSIDWAAAFCVSNSSDLVISSDCGRITCFSVPSIGSSLSDKPKKYGAILR